MIYAESLILSAGAIVAFLALNRKVIDWERNEAVRKRDRLLQNRKSKSAQSVIKAHEEFMRDHSRAC